MEGLLSRPGRRTPALAATGLAAMLGLLAVAPGASAGPLTDAVGTCDGQVASKVFAPWADFADYVPVPNGDLASGSAGWDLDGAQIVEENEPWHVNGPSAPAAVRVAQGETATTPAMCVTAVYPTLRLFARNVGAPLGTLRVDVLFEDLLGRVQSLPIGVVAGGDAWAPTLPVVVVANLLTLLPGGRTPVAFRFVPQGTDSDWLIDDANVDPYCKR